MNPTDFDTQVMRPLRRQARRLRTIRALDGAGWVAVFIWAVLTVQLVLDWWLRLRWDMRAALLVAVLAAAAWAAWRRILRPLRLRFGAREMAAAVEQRQPDLDATLISAVEFHTGRAGTTPSNSPELIAAVVGDTARRAGSIAFDAIVNPRPLRRASARLVAVLTLAVVGLVFAPQTLGIWIDRNLLLREVPWPQRTELLVDVPEDGIIRGALGDDLDIRARVPEGYVPPRQVEIIYRTQSGKTGRELMTGVGERGYRVTFPRVKEAFTFYLEGGDDVTPEYKTRLSERPLVVSAEMTVNPPAYTRLPVLSLPDGQRAVEIYPGSALTIAATTNKPVTQARLVAADSAATAEVAIARTHLHATVLPAASQTWQFELVDSNGLRNARPVRFSVRLLQDETPKVRIRARNVGNLVTLSAVLPLEATFTDDLGLASVEVHYQRSAANAPPGTVPLPGFSANTPSFDAQLEWPIAESGAAVGEQVTVFARASDFDDVSGPHTGESSAITFRVATEDELLAEFNRREQEYRRQFERLVDSQERLRGRLLPVLEEINSPEVRDDVDLLLAPLERSQRQITAQVNVVRQQFEQVLAELAINRLDTAEVRARLGAGVIDPLTTLGTRDLPDAADLLHRLQTQPGSDLAARVDPGQAAILSRMRLVLDNMLKWEGYQETVTMLREILRLQRELNEETRKTLDEQGGDFFND